MALGHVGPTARGCCDRLISVLVVLVVLASTSTSCTVPVPVGLLLIRNPSITETRFVQAARPTPTLQAATTVGLVVVVVYQLPALQLPHHQLVGVTVRPTSRSTAAAARAARCLRPMPLRLLHGGLRFVKNASAQTSVCL